jgi:hypothetical protein
MVGWNGHDYLGVFKDPSRGATEYRIGASEQADGSWDFTLYCPFDSPLIATTKHGKDIPSKRLGIECGACGRFFRFQFPAHLVARQAVGAMNLRDFPLSLRNDFKAMCAKEGLSMSQALEVLMRAALKGAVDVRFLARGDAKTVHEVSREVSKGEDATGGGLTAPLDELPSKKRGKGRK